MTALPAPFLSLPLAHRGLHDSAAGMAENSPAAFRAALRAGYGIELDVQLSADGVAMVFHDDDLDRLTAEAGPVRQRPSADLGRMALKGGGGTIPTLTEVLELVAGCAPLLIEIKDQDGVLGPDTGTLEAATAATLVRYKGPVAVMSFNPHAVAAFARAAPGTVRGLVTDAFARDDWALVPAARREALRLIPDYERLGCAFISHAAHDLANPRVSALKAAGAAVLCWTIRSPEAEAEARRVADNITFEGYAPALPAT